MIEERPYQQRIITKTLYSFQNGANSVMIEAPPGAGKTIIGLSACKRMIEDGKDLFGKNPEEITVGWVAMRRNLLKQAASENEKVECPNVKFVSMFTKDPPKVDILVTDEGHHAAAATCVSLHNQCKPKFSLGLSATPFRTDSMKLCFSKIIKDAGFHKLIQDGYLSQFDHWMIPEWSVSQVTKTYIDRIDEWGKSAIFFNTIAECEDAAKIISDAGVKCEVVTGVTDRDTQIDSFIDGDTQVLLNVYVLSEGFDAPLMETVFVRDSSKGPSLQMAGRVLRKHEKIPITNIVQSINTRHPFTKTATARIQYLYRDGWRSVGQNEMVKIMNDFMIKRVMNTEVSLPSYLQERQSKKKKVK